MAKKVHVYVQNGRVETADGPPPWSGPRLRVEYTQPKCKNQAGGTVEVTARWRRGFLSAFEKAEAEKFLMREGLDTSECIFYTIEMQAGVRGYGTANAVAVW